MSSEEIVAAINTFPARLVVITGGEPGLFIDRELISAIKATGRTVAVETNGTCGLPDNIDYIVMSPKDAFCPHATPVLTACDELKVVYTGDNDPGVYAEIKARHRILQPCDTGDASQNAAITAGALEYCLTHPGWRLGLQLHKLLNVR